MGGGPRRAHIAKMTDRGPTPPAKPPAPAAAKPPPAVKETGGPKGPEPTRYGDWERNGRCVDF
ncbi:MAG: succinate dehydrogenase assembly factor 4 [Dongiaceae bacterium]